MRRRLLSEKHPVPQMTHPTYITRYTSPLGPLLLSASETHLTGLWFEGIKPLAILERNDLIELALHSSVSGGNKILYSAVTWLDEYFSGKIPDIKIPLYFAGTDFQKEVWEILCKIPYGKTLTYGEIAKEIASKRGIKTMSAQAVGNAVGKNPISIICPCHRVIGSDGSMTGYAWGIDVKMKLLELEKTFSLT